MVTVKSRPVGRIVVGGVTAFAASYAVVVGCGLLLSTAFVDNGPTPFDADITNWFVDHRSQALTTFMKAATWLGSTAIIVPLALVVVVLLVLRRRVVLAAYLVLAVGGASLLSVLAKHAVGRERPLPSIRLADVLGSAFPSGHATQATAAYIALAVCGVSFVRNARLRIVIWVVAITVIVVVGVSRVYLGVHWATDVIGGWMLGGLWVGGLTVAFVWAFGPDFESLGKEVG
jgi:undecaprenyl-diphosphatase